MTCRRSVLVFAVLLVVVDVLPAQQKAALTTPDLVLVDGGILQMGSTSGESDEKPVHTVTVSGFLMARHEVTQAAYLSVMGTNPSQFVGDATRPVEQVSWYEAVAYCNALSDLTGLERCYTISDTKVSCDFAKDGYRLPTEAEWEFAARGGASSRGYTYAGSNTVDDVAWHGGNSANATHPVGTKAPNELGLYDMSGNVWEWCWDWYRQYQTGTQTDPTGPSSGSERTARGGSWFYRSVYERPVHRGNVAPDVRSNGIGFRVVRRAKAPIPMVLVEGSTFRMGDTAGGGGDDEKPVHSVTLSSFYLGTYEVTQKEWVAVMGSNPSATTGDRLPVEQVSWLAAVEFCNRLSGKEELQPCYTISGTSVTCGFLKNGYRLPAEAEWEYAARGGKLSRGYVYAGGNDPGVVAWYFDNSGDSTHLVGGKQPNELGLYDMTGNVSEWCWDWYGPYPSSSQTDPRGPSAGEYRVLRGGSCDHFVQGLRLADRDGGVPGEGHFSRGFRLARSAGPAGTTESALPKPPEVFVLVEGWSFRMGDAATDGRSFEKPVHSVTVASFTLGKYEVTQKEWVAVMGSNPSRFKGDSLPVEQVSWLDAVSYCNRRSVREGLESCYTIRGTAVTCDFTRNGYRLPTEAEWEYAARGGRSSRGYTYAGGNDIGAVSWYRDNSAGSTQPVGGKQPNELGLYDMSGNVWEWCWDWHEAYGSSAQSDPRGPTDGSDRVLRGGDYSGSFYQRCVARSYDGSDPATGGSFGLRVVRRGL